MKLLIIISSAIALSMLSFLKIDFGHQADGQDWQVVVDGVMGGLSKGYLSFTDEGLLLKGTVSLENNGGFSSVRGPLQNMDLSGFSTVEIRYRAKGQSFGFRLATDQRWWMPNYKSILTADSEDWQIAKFKLTEFKEYEVGRPTGRLIPDDKLKRIIRMGFITNDKKAGPFELEVDYILFEK